MSSFNPNSFDAVLARIGESLDTLKAQQTEMRTEMNAGFEKMGSRVSVLERDKWYQRGAAAAISGAVVLAWHVFTGKQS